MASVGAGSPAQGVCNVWLATNTEHESLAPVASRAEFYIFWQASPLYLKFSFCANQPEAGC